MHLFLQFLTAHSLFPLLPFSLFLGSWIELFSRGQLNVAGSEKFRGSDRNAETIAR